MEANKQQSVDLTASWKKLQEAIQQSKRFLLTGHVRADGDCVGAQAALYHVLRSMGKQASILLPDPLSPRYEFLREHTQFSSFDEKLGAKGIPEHDTLFVLDINNLDRTGPLAPHLRNAKSTKIVFDHHQPTQGQTWDVEIIDPTAAATGLLVYRFAKFAGIPLTPAAAEGVFLSLVTDTGWFKYSNTDTETLRVAAELVSAGIDPSIMFQHVYQQRSLNWVKGLSASLQTVSFHLQGRLAVTELPMDLPGVDRVEIADSEEVLDILRAVGPVEVVAVLRQETPDKVKLSFRSKGEFDVNQFAKQYDGGGHRRAAGAEITGKLVNVRKKVTDDLSGAMQKDRA